MHLTHLKLTNFRGFTSLDLTLDRHLTVLVGRNGSGKSSVLDAIQQTLHLHRSEPTILTPASIHTKASSGEVQLYIDYGAPEDLRLEINGTSSGWRREFHVDKIEAAVSLGMARSAAGERLVPGRMTVYWQLASTYLVDAHFTKFEQLLAWMREREDLENQERVRRRDLDFVDPALESARQAIQSFLGEGYTRPRIDRAEETRLLIDKDGEPLSAASLSDGERSLVVIAGDLARRMALAHPEAASVREADAIVLIDEIELHLHPSWQQRIIDALRETFPNAQFILTTHSPQVLAQVPAESLRILENFQVYSPAHPVRGRDANAILREVMGTPERPRFVLDLVAMVEQAIDEARFDEASSRLDELRGLLGSDDSEILRLGTMLHFLDPTPADAEGARS